MARPTKQGVDYFPLDVGFLQDFKIKRIMNSYGCVSIAVLVCLLCNIYKDKGYYMLFTDETADFIAVECGVKCRAVNDIVAKAVQVGFFDEHIYTEHKILTSKGIQNRYFMVSSRRKERFCRRDIMLININDCNNSVNDCNNSVNVYNNSYYKENKIKRKERIKNGSEATTVSNLKFFENQKKVFDEKIRQLDNYVAANGLKSIDVTDILKS